MPRLEFWSIRLEDDVESSAVGREKAVGRSHATRTRLYAGICFDIMILFPLKYATS